MLVASAENQLLPGLKSQVIASALFTDAEKAQLIADLTTILAQATSDWKNIVSQYSIAQIVATHGQFAQQNCATIKRTIFGLPAKDQPPWLDAWFDGMAALGWAFAGQCRFPAQSSATDNCWTLNLPQPTNDAEWQTLDEKLSNTDDFFTQVSDQVRGNPL